MLSPLHDSLDEVMFLCIFLLPLSPIPFSAEAGSWDPKTPPKDKLPAPPPTPRRPSTSEKSTQSVTSTDDETQQRRRACRRFMPRGVRIVKSAELATP